MQYKIETTDADNKRTADGVFTNEHGAWLGEWNPSTTSVDVLTDEDGDYIPAPENWKELVTAQVIGIEAFHAKVYELAKLPEDAVINIFWKTDDDAELVAGDVVQAAKALGHTGELLKAAEEGDVSYINNHLCDIVRDLLDVYEIENA